MSTSKFESLFPSITLFCTKNSIMSFFYPAPLLMQTSHVSPPVGSVLQIALYCGDRCHSSLRANPRSFNSFSLSHSNIHFTNKSRAAPRGEGRRESWDYHVILFGNGCATGRVAGHRGCRAEREGDLLDKLGAPLAPELQVATTTNEALPRDLTNCL